MRAAVCLVLASVLLAVLAATPAAALTVNEIAREVRCPTCERPLNVSDAPAAQQMRVYIADLIAQGWSRERIIEALVAEFGEGVLATPPKRGFGLVAWLVPVGVLVAGLVALPLLARRWRRRRESTPAEGPATLSDDERRRLEEALMERR